MCVIVDVNVAHEVFGTHLQLTGERQAGHELYDWITTGQGQLVIGGKLRKELNKDPSFRKWAKRGRQYGIMKKIDDREVESRTTELIAENQCKSDDHHIIALSQISGARLLYSNDRDLHKDFKNKQLIDNPRGKVYSTMKETEYKDRHKRLLENRDLCRTR